MRLIASSRSLQVSVQQYINTALMVTAVLEHGLTLLECQKLTSICRCFQSVHIQSLGELTFAEDLPHEVSLDDVLETVSETSSDVLATHRYDHASSLGHESIGPDAPLHQNGVLTEAVHFLEFVVLLLDEHRPLLDDIKRIGIIALIEDDLTLLVGLSETGGSQGVFLVLSEILEEGEHVEELFILLLVLLVDLLHHLQEDSTVYLRQLAVSQRQDRGRPRRIIDYTKVTERVTIGESAFLLSAYLHLTDSLKDDVV